MAPAEVPEEKASSSGKGKDRETYNTVAETVGLLPSLRWKDNVIQGVVVGITTVVAALVGLVWQGGQGLVIGTLVGLLASLLLSGIVLMIVGWVRAARKIAK